MINETATEIVEILDQFTHQQKLRQQSKSISEILAMLAQILSTVDNWQELFASICDYVSDEEVESLQRESLAIAQEMEKYITSLSEGEFAPIEPLQKVKSKLNSLLGRTKDSWVRYRKGKLETYEKLAKVARRFPNMQDQIPQVDHLLQKIREIPTTQADIDRFHRSLESLRTILSRLEGLPPDVQKFLDSLLTDSATIDLITDNVLAWCRRERLTPRLRIKFE